MSQPDDEECLSPLLVIGHTHASLQSSGSGLVAFCCPVRQELGRDCSNRRANTCHDTSHIEWALGWCRASAPRTNQRLSTWRASLGCCTGRDTTPCDPWWTSPSGRRSMFLLLSITRRVTYDNLCRTYLTLFLSKIHFITATHLKWHLLSRIPAIVIM